MIKITSLFLVAICLISCQTRETSKHLTFVSEEEKALRKFKTILSDLDSIISNSDNKDLRLETNYRLVRNHIFNNQITIKFDTTLNHGFRGCAAAGYVEGDSSSFSLSFGRFIIEAYRRFPFLVQSIIIHEFQHLNDFYVNPGQIRISEENPIEKTYFEIDGLFLESVFMKTYVGKRDNLSPVEAFLLADENLLGSSILFEKVDLELLHQMDEIKTRQVSFPEGKREFIQIGQKLLEMSSIQKQDDEWSSYCYAVKLRTYIYYSKQVLRDLLFILGKQSYSDAQLALDKYPDISRIVNQLEEKLEANDRYLSYQDTFIAENYDKTIRMEIESGKPLSK